MAPTCAVLSMGTVISISVSINLALEFSWLVGRAGTFIASNTQTSNLLFVDNRDWVV
jgi:hypothetical protein